MNINKAIWGITALALCLALAGCPAVDEEDGTAKLNVPGMEPVSNLQDFPDTIRSVGLITEATTLFNNATTVLTAKTGINNNLWTQDTAVYYADSQLFPVDRIHDYSQAKDKTITMGFEGEEGVDLENLTNPIVSGVTAGKIYGSNTATAIVNGPESLGNYYGTNFINRVNGVTQIVQDDGLREKNESVTERFSGNRTFEITDGFYGNGTAPATPYVAGYVTVDYSGATKKTQTDNKEKHDIYIESSNDDIKFSITIVAYTTGATGTGAKFRLSGTSKGSSATTRSVSNGSAVVVSNLEVYTNNGSKIYDLPPDQFGVNSAAWFTFAKDIVARSLFEKFKSN
jgi:hypothetical protein